PRPAAARPVRGGRRGRRPAAGGQRRDLRPRRGGGRRRRARRGGRGAGGADRADRGCAAMKMKRIAVLAGAVVLAALLAAHVVYWYLPRERAVVPRLGAGGGAALPAAGAAGGSAGGAAGEPLQVLSAGAYDVCVWVPYPHQNLGALAAAIRDLRGAAGQRAGGLLRPRGRAPEGGGADLPGAGGGGEARRPRRRQPLAR